MIVERVSAHHCTMWPLHQRLGEHITATSCSDLITSMRQHGQKRPVLARRLRGNGASRFELIFGARRLFVAQQLNLDLLVEVRDIDDSLGLVEMDIENRVRTDISPYERGLSYRQWLARGYFKNQCELARKLGISEAQVSRLLKYAELPAAVVGAFSSPAAIREDWAVALARRSQNPESRNLLMRRARERTKYKLRRAPHETYAALMSDLSERPIDSRSRDEIVKDGSGKPIFRIGLRARTIHLVLPRERVSQSMLRDIARQLQSMLESTASECSSHAVLEHSPSHIVPAVWDRSISQSSLT
jgi:ParB/RepB/Spo0J family partition protein